MSVVISCVMLYGLALLCCLCVCVLLLFNAFVCVVCNCLCVVVWCTFCL